MAREYFGQNTIQNQAAQSNQVWEARQQARQGVVDQFDTIDDPRDVPIDRTEDGGLAPGREFLEWAEPQEVAHQMDREIDHYDVGTDDVHAVDDGGAYELTPGAERRVAASEFEQETPLEAVDPQDDVQRANGDEFELTDPALERIFDIDPGFF